jgi:phosphomannomutase
MADISGIFKAYDIRGKVTDELTPDVVEKIGRAMADWLPEKGIVSVGRDMRPDSEALANAMIAGLIKQGRDVWDIGQVTSDMIYFAVGSNNLAGGAMITASHNPGEYNGIKICREEAKPVGEDSGLFEIRDAVLAGTFQANEASDNVTEKSVTEDWIQHVLSFIDAAKVKQLKVSVDAGNGMAGAIFPEIEPYLPIDVNEMYFDLDGTFPNHIANPLEPKNLIDLQQDIKANHSDVGIAFDGDGDRAVLVDENGEALTGTVLSAMLACYFLDKEPGATILLNAICGRAAVEAVEAKGGRVLRTRVGHSFIKADMRKHNAIFAGEHSGHYYFRDNFMADSGLLAATIGLFILSTSGKPLSALVAPYRQAYVQIPETNFEVADKQAVLDKLADTFTDGKLETLDGLTIEYNDSWFNVRPSNTEPLLRLNAEAKSKDRLDALVARVKQVIAA